MASQRAPASAAGGDFDALVSAIVHIHEQTHLTYPQIVESLTPQSLLLPELGSLLALAQGLRHQIVSGELNKQIRRLLGSGLIEYTLPDKPNSRLQQYRLTAQGKALLK